MHSEDVFASVPEGGVIRTGDEICILTQAP